MTTKRYNLAIPIEVYEAVAAEADRRQISVVELLRKFIKLGLLAAQIENDPNATLLIREDGKIQELILV